MDTAILAPAAALALWSLVMLFWLVVTRLPAISKAGIDMGSQPGGRGQDLEGVLEPKVNWKAHNYAHLMEQPTIFYPVVIILFLTSSASSLAVGLAWGYVGLRIVHSIWQATVNQIPVRLLLFSLGTLCLLALTILALLATI